MSGWRVRLGSVDGQGELRLSAQFHALVGKGEIAHDAVYAGT